jgi:hypothetical protein
MQAEITETGREMQFCAELSVSAGVAVFPEDGTDLRSAVHTRRLAHVQREVQPRHPHCGLIHLYDRRSTST